MLTRKRRYASTKLEEKAGRREGTGAGWVYFEQVYDEEDGTTSLVIETSWLPGSEPEINRSLKPLGFKRRKDGAWRIALTNEQIADRLGVTRIIARAFDALLTECVYGYEKDRSDGR